MFTAIIASLAMTPSEGAQLWEYTPATYTQSISKLNEYPNLRLVKISEMPDKRWQQSGGMDQIPRSSYTSRKFRSGPRPQYKVKLVPVKNSFGYYQNELGLTRVYPDGARFDDVLYNANGVVFEHRVRYKEDGKWVSQIEYRDVAARPEGYTGLTVSCASCHNEAGTGGYAVGLVPGGDTVLSDPMDWGVVDPVLTGYR